MSSWTRDGLPTYFWVEDNSGDVYTANGWATSVSFDIGAHDLIESIDKPLLLELIRNGDLVDYEEGEQVRLYQDVMCVMQDGPLPF
ncbi:hypothetical protein ACI2KR_08765 [Pseudomonas luteola]